MNLKRAVLTRKLILRMIRQGVKGTYEVSPEDLPKAGKWLNMEVYGQITKRFGECRTVACLGGYMTLDPELRKEGLRNEGDYRPDLEYYSLMPSYAGKEEGANSLADFLEIQYREARTMFDGNQPNNLKLLLRQFEELCRRNGVDAEKGVLL